MKTTEVLTLVILIGSAWSLPMMKLSDLDLDRDARQWGLGYLPSVGGMHSLDLGSFGKLELGVNPDGTVGIGGNFNPITGINLAGHADVAASLQEGIGFHANGAAELNNEMLGVHAGINGASEGGLSTSGIHGHGQTASNVEVEGLGALHGGLDAGAGLGLSMQGLSADLAGGVNAGGEVNHLGGINGGVGGGVGAGVGLGGVTGRTQGGVNGGVELLGVGVNAGVNGGVNGGVGLGGVSVNTEGGVNAGAHIGDLLGVQGGVNGGVGGTVGINGIEGRVSGGATGGATSRV